MHILFKPFFGFWFLSISWHLLFLLPSCSTCLQSIWHFQNSSASLWNPRCSKHSTKTYDFTHWHTKLLSSTDCWQFSTCRCFHPKSTLILPATLGDNHYLVHPPLPVSTRRRLSLLCVQIRPSQSLWNLDHLFSAALWPILESVLLCLPQHAGLVLFSLSQLFYEASSCPNPPNGMPIALDRLFANLCYVWARICLESTILHPPWPVFSPVWVQTRMFSIICLRTPSPRQQERCPRAALLLCIFFSLAKVNQAFLQVVLTFSNICHYWLGFRN